MSTAEAEGIQVLITTDRGFKSQQNVADRKLGVLVVQIHPLTRRRLLAIASQIDSEALQVLPGEVRTLEG